MTGIDPIFLEDDNTQVPTYHKFEWTDFKGTEGAEI